VSLVISDLKVRIGDKEILNGIDLEVGAGELHVLMGPNGSGKSTLAQVIAGYPSYIINGGSIIFNGKKMNKLTPDKRAKLGIFLAFQHPVEIPGVSVFGMLRKAKQVISAKSQVPSKKKTYNLGLKTSNFAAEFRQELLECLSSLKLSGDFLSRSLNEGFSGGEKKRSEILQMMALKPKLAILDEIDSGLDVDALKLVANAIREFTVHSSQSSVLLITHYARILKYLKPDFVHVMVDGRIVRSGRLELAKLVEEKGYQNFEKEVKYA